jgi:hypothetical protein
MLNRALPLLLALTLLPTAALAAEPKPKPRPEDRLLYAEPETTPWRDGRAYAAPRPTVDPLNRDPLSSANGS